MTGKPLYAFGYGLSYTTFRYGAIKLAANSVKAGDSVHVQGQATNTGDIAGDEVAELYLAQPQTEVSPRLVLAGFRRIHLQPGKSAEIDFTLDPRTLSEVDADGKRAIMPGEYRIFLGGSQPGNESPANTAVFTVNGTMELPK